MGKNRRAQSGRAKTKDKNLQRSTPERKGPIQSQFIEQMLRERVAEKIHKKQLRQKIASEFQAMMDAYKEPNLAVFLKFVIKRWTDLDLLREALSPSKRSEDPWSVAAWEWLSLQDDELDRRIERWTLQPRISISIDAISKLQRSLPNPLVMIVPTTTDGPSYADIEAERIIKEVEKYVGYKVPALCLEEIPSWTVLGDYDLNLVFQTGERFPIRVRLELEKEQVPESLAAAWRGIECTPYDADTAGLAAMQASLDALTSSNDKLAELTLILKKAYISGYWKAGLVRDAIRQWEDWEGLARRTMAPKSGAGPSQQIARFEKSIPRQEPQLGWDMIIEEENDDARKLRVLNLPPLVAYDLLTATVDMNTMQHLFAARHLSHLKGKRVEEFSDADIRSLSYGINKEIQNIRIRRQGAISSRTLASIMMAVAHLQFQRLEMGTSDMAIRFALSGYSTEMGRYLIEEHGRYDMARDYYLEAISLNLTSQRGVDFPTDRLFRSFLPEAKRQIRDIDPGRVLSAFAQSGLVTNKEIQTASRCFLELGTHHYPWAIKWFEACPEKRRSEMLTAMRSQLALSASADFARCTDSYFQAFARLQGLFHQLYDSLSIHGIVEIRSELEEQLKKLGFLVNPTNREIAALLIKAAEILKEYLRIGQYEERREQANTAITLLERVIACENDNYTALWAAYLRPVAEKWRLMVRNELVAAAREIAPKIDIRLAEDRLSLTDPRLDKATARVIVRVENCGSGTADRVNVRLIDGNGETLASKLRPFHLPPGKGEETYFEPNLTSSSLQFDYSVSYYDPDRKYVERHSLIPLMVGPVQQRPALDELRNPFKEDKEVTDENLFVGREKSLREVADAAANDGGLLMLYGQKRVGKSSFLNFLEKRLDLERKMSGILAVRVDWLNFSHHNPWMVMAEIAMAIKSKFHATYGQFLPIPSRADFEKSFTFALNDVLRELEESKISRLVLMVDEFDVIVQQREHPELGYDRAFFEYLRGLSKRSQVTLALTGGEMMPILFESLGDVFNHDRHWRLNYLSPTDGSVEKLIRNQYVEGILSFTDEAIEKIKDLTACNPFFVQMICRELVNAAKMQQSDCICELDVEEIRQLLIDRGHLDSKYVLHLYSPLSKPDPLELAIIGTLSELELRDGRPRFVPQEELLERIAPDYKDRTITAIGLLVRREILWRNPEDNMDLKMTLPIFRDWFNVNKPAFKDWSSLVRR